MKKRIFLLLICLLTLAVSICLFTACDETETPDNSGGTTDGGNSGGTTDGGTTDGGNGGGESKPNIYTLTFKADGTLVDTVIYSVNSSAFTMPKVPNKAGYTGEWEKIDFSTESNITVNAIYTPITYTVAFKADGVEIGKVNFTVETESITAPSVPNKTGYIGVWESYTLGTESITVNAVYTPITYTATFKADGNTVETVEFTVETESITEPDIPEKLGHVAIWESYELIADNITVNAIYTAGEYYVTFMNGQTEVGKVAFTYGDTEIIEPKVPSKQCYTGTWESYTLGAENITVNSVYTLSHTALSKMEATSPQCNKTGNIEYYACAGCDKFFSDSEGKVEILDKSSVVISTVSCSYVNNICKWCGGKKPSEGLTYTLSNDQTYYTVTGIGTCEDTEIVIPSKYNDKPVREIGEGAFYECARLTSVTIPDSVTSISDLAFALCTGLASINVLEDNIAYKSIDGNLYTKDEKTLVQFALGKNNTDFTIPNTVTTVGMGAFAYAPNLLSITIPDSVIDIEGYALIYCEKLTSVTLGRGIKTIGEYAFEECYKLKSVNYLGDIASWCSISFEDYGANPLYGLHYFYINGELVTDLVISGTVEIINDRTFHGYQGLSSVVISDSVETIGFDAFAYCENLTSVTIGSGVTSIGEDAFYSCDKLVEVINKSTLTITKGSKDNGYVGYYALEIHNVESKIVNKDGYLFITYNGVNYLLGYVGTDTALNLPSDFNGQNYQIYKYAFYNNNKITSVAIPDSVTTIGDSAFYWCDRLTSVTIGNSVETIGSSAFEDCTSLTSVTIGSGVTSIGDSAFMYCTSLTNINVSEENTVYKSIDGNLYTKDGKTLIQYAIGKTDASFTIPNTVETIGSSAFEYCSSLTSVTIPDSVKTIDYFAFYSCRSLTSVTIGNSVTSIGSYAFRYCNSLTSVTIGNSVTTIGYSAFRNCTSLTSVTIGNSVETIGSEAFLECNKLVEVINKSTLTITKGSIDNGYVGYYALEIHEGESKIVNKDGYLFITYNGVNYLLGYVGTDTALNLPSDFNGQKYEIYKYAFYNNDKITSVVIPDSVTTIGYEAFYSCDSLTSVTIGNGVTSIGNSAFYNTGCYKNEENWENGVLYIGKYLIEAKDTISGAYAIKNGTLCIADYAFYWRDSLASVVIPDSVKTIGSHVFAHCNSLTSVTIGSGVTSIGNYAFDYCNKLVEVINKSTLTITKGSSSNGYVGYYALEIHNGESKIVNKDGYLFITYNGVNYLLGYVGPDTALNLPSDFNGQKYQIYKYAFYNNNKITSVVIPDSVTSIGSSAFMYRTSLTSVTIGNGVETIGSSAFAYCDSLTSVTIGNNVTTIGEGAFLGCTKLTNVTIGNNVDEIASSAFRNCTSLTSITVAEDNTVYKSIEGNLYTKDGKTLIQYAIGKTDTSFTIPNTVETIGDDAFFLCSRLTSVTIPDSVTSIGDDAFYFCDSLTSVEIPNSVTTIGNSAFYNCTSLASIKYRGTEAQWNAVSKGSSWDIGAGNYKVSFENSGEGSGEGSDGEEGSIQLPVIPT